MLRSPRRDRTKECQYFWKVDLKRAETNPLPLFSRAAPLTMYLQRRRVNERKGKKTATVFSTSVCEGCARAREEWRPSFRCFQSLNGSSPSVLTPSRAHAGTTLLSLPFRDTHARSHWTRPRCTRESAHNTRKHFAFVNMRKQRRRFRTYVQASLKVCLVIPIRRVEKAKKMARNFHFNRFPMSLQPKFTS